MAGTHVLIIGGIRIVGWLFTDDFAVASFTSYGLQNKFDLVHKYCNGRNLRCNMNKSKIIFFLENRKFEGSREMET
jgi:hypothetical protein